MTQQRESSREMAFRVPTRAFAEAWPDSEIVQQAVGQLPWGHNLVLLTKLKDPARLAAWHSELSLVS